MRSFSVLLCLAAFVAASFGQCPTFYELDTLTGVCVAVACDASPCASGEVCQVQSVQCIRAPCPQFTCQAVPVCAAGFELDTLTNVCVAVSCDANPCASGEVCQVQSVQCIRAPCPQYTCQAVPVCAAGFALDTFTNQCVPVSCVANPCASGETCNAISVQCIRAPCPQYECVAAPVCPANFDLDTITGACVPVNCAANPCASNRICLATSVQCIRAPCPQYTCVKPAVCKTGFALDRLTNTCVAVTCAARPCPSGKRCVTPTTPIMCIRAPCPQYTCV